jgi:hypothetical protein
MSPAMARPIPAASVGDGEGHWWWWYTGSADGGDNGGMMVATVGDSEGK